MAQYTAAKNVPNPAWRHARRLAPDRRTERGQV